MTLSRDSLTLFPHWVPRSVDLWWTLKWVDFLDVKCLLSPVSRLVLVAGTTYGGLCWFFSGYVDSKEFPASNHLVESTICGLNTQRLGHFFHKYMYSISCLLKVSRPPPLMWDLVGLGIRLLISLLITGSSNFFGIVTNSVRGEAEHPYISRVALRILT